MGSRRLPRRALIALGAAILLAPACDGGADAAPAPTATATIAATVAPTETPTPVPPPPTATPDLLGGKPRTGADAAGKLEAFFAAQPALGACPAAPTSSWGAKCLEGDFDGDSRKDFAFLVPVTGSFAGGNAPASVLVRRAASARVDVFPANLDADASPLGLATFAATDRTGDQRAELAYLAITCGAHTCTSRLELQSWDGTAWRDAGPGDEGIASLDRIAFEGKGAGSRVTVHGGVILSMGAGPQRASTTVYAWNGSRYAASEVRPDPPEFLFHAILDADALFDAAKFDAAIAAYRAALANPALQDWLKVTGGGEGRNALEGYALFRIAVATAAQGKDATAELDRVITGSKEPLFAALAEAFRKGLQERAGVHAGCIEATRYLQAAGVTEYLRTLFDYGYGNPHKKATDICSL